MARLALIHASSLENADLQISLGSRLKFHASFFFTLSATGDMSQSTEPPQPGAQKPARKARKFPTWLDHFNARDLKVLFRCSVAAWVASLLMFIEPSLHAIGTATFFACLVIFMVPPSGVVFIFVLGTLTLLIGVALAWAWGMIAMKAALAARPDAETQARLQSLQQEVQAQVQATGQSPAAVQRKLIFDGFMLDARVSAVYFCLICLFIYLLARLRAKNPKFALLQIFGTIIADLFLTIAPSLPTFSGTMPKLLIVPAAIGVGLGLASSFLFFPQSTSHIVLGGMEGLVSLSRRPLEFTLASFEDEEDTTLEDLRAAKASIIAASKEIEPAVAFLPLDFSVGRWNADDIKSLTEPVRQTVMASVSLLEFHITRLAINAKRKSMAAYTQVDTNKADEKGPRQAGKRQLMEHMELVHALQTPEAETLQAETVETLRKSSTGTLSACQEAIATTVECIHAANSRRWLGRLSRGQNDQLVERSRSVLEALASARSSFASETTERLLQTHADAFDEGGNLKREDTRAGHSVRGIMTGLVFEQQVLAMADASEKLLSHAITLLQHRPTIKAWFPTSIRYAAAWVFRRKMAAPIPGQSQETETDPEDEDTQSEDARQRLRISRGYQARRRSGLGKAILGTYHWLIDAEGLYGLRMVVVTIALAIPAVIPSSAGFYYRAKGLWALIMGQTAVLVYMSDFVFSAICRVVGTVVGGAVGLVAWYIGSGHGPGNSYGLAAIMAAVIIVFMWARLFLSPAFLQATILAAATCVLIVGYSYDDTHIPLYGNPGVGYSVFWRRLVLVLVGMVAASVVQVFPRPPSASRHIRKSLSNAIRSLSDHYALLISSWAQRQPASAAAADRRFAEQISLDLAETLTTLDGPIALLRFEFSSSPFDSKSLEQVKTLCHAINLNLGRLLALSASLPLDLQARLARGAGLLEDRNVGDVMAVIGVVEQALKTGDALPEVLPTPLLKRCLVLWGKRAAGGEGLGLTAELVRDEGYRRFCVAVSSYLKVLGAVDELVLVVKEVLGEAHVVSRDIKEV